MDTCVNFELDLIVCFPLCILWPTYHLAQYRQVKSLGSVGPQFLNHRLTWCQPGWVPKVRACGSLAEWDIFLDSSRAEGIWHTWDSTSLSVTRVSSDCLLVLSDTALRLEAAHLEQCLLASGTSRIVALFRWLRLSWSLFACTPLMIESIKCHRGLYIHSPLE